MKYNYYPHEFNICETYFDSQLIQNHFEYWLVESKTIKDVREALNRLSKVFYSEGIAEMLSREYPEILPIFEKLIILE